jgi:flagellar hook protein FlgE
MSLNGAMQTGVAGLSAYSNALSVASANIANVNTVGYKTATSDFSTLLASASTSSDSSSASVVSSSGQNVVQQGLLQTSTSATDLAISGSGFFVVSPTSGDTTSREYTRAGSFSTDSAGILKNASGQYLLGWKLNPDGSVPSDRNDMTTINTNTLAGKADATKNMSVNINLQASTTISNKAAGYNTGDMSLDSSDAAYVPPDFQRTINVYDSQGGSQPLQLSFLKTGTNTWQYEVSYQGTDTTNITTTYSGFPKLVSAGTCSFGADGTLTSVTPNSGSLNADGTVPVAIPWTQASGLQVLKDPTDPTSSVPQAIELSFGKIGSSTGLTQFDSPSAMSSSKVDGALFGSLTGVSVDKDGTVTAQFSNGLTQPVYKIPLATFANPDGLSQTSGNAYAQSMASGSPTISEADAGSAGMIQSKNLEASTVDLATEFTSLITTQRAYSAASKIVTTASTMLDELLQMAR